MKRTDKSIIELYISIRAINRLLPFVIDNILYMIICLKTSIIYSDAKFNNGFTIKPRDLLIYSIPY